jgi:hypothetical protein
MLSNFRSSGAAAGLVVVGAFATGGAGAGILATAAGGVGDGLGADAGMLTGVVVGALGTAARGTGAGATGGIGWIAGAAGNSASGSGVAAGAGVGAGDSGASATTVTTVTAAGATVATGSDFCACFTPQQPAAKAHAKATTVRIAHNVAARSIITLSGSGTTDRTCAKNSAPRSIDEAGALQIQALFRRESVWFSG